MENHGTENYTFRRGQVCPLTGVDLVPLAPSGRKKVQFCIVCGKLQIIIDVIVSAPVKINIGLCKVVCLWQN